MIEFINVKNYKALYNSSFPLASLNLFSGLNGMGKSSLVQCMLLLRQSYQRKLIPGKGLLLNGDYIQVGTGKDALSTASDVDEISFTFKWEHHEDPLNFKFEHSPDSDLLKGGILESNFAFEGQSLFNSKFQYLCADRLSPQSHHQLSDY